MGTFEGGQNTFAYDMPTNLWRQGVEMWWYECECLPIGIYIFECLVPRWLKCLGTIKKGGLVRGGISLGMDFEVSRAHAIPS